MSSHFSRRQFMQAGGAALAARAARATAQQRVGTGQPGRYRFGLNTGTLRGYQLGLAEQIDAAAKAGYDGIEPWLRLPASAWPR